MPGWMMPVPHENAPLGKFERFPGDGEGAYKTGHYRNLFQEQGHTPAETHAKIEKAFQQLFHGDGQEERIYFETGANENGTLAYVTDWANNDARTEGMSYGMMICVELGKKREFDALWNWAHTYMLITDPKDPSVGYFAWSMNTDGTPRSTGAAPDGEEYFTMALYFAARRWGNETGGNGKGIYDYQAEADKILRGMRHHPVLTGTGPFRIHPDDPPFVQPDHPWPGIGTERAEAEAKAAGRPWPPQYFRFMRGRAATGNDWADGRRGAQHDQVCAQLAGWRDGRVVSPACVLRVVGAVGPGGGSHVLGDGSGCEPRLFSIA